MIKDLNKHYTFRQLEKFVNHYFETNFDAFLGGFIGICLTMMIFTWFTTLCLREKISDYKENEAYLERLKMTYPGYAEIRKIEEKRRKEKEADEQFLATLKSEDRETIKRIRAANRKKSREIAESIGMRHEDLVNGDFEDENFVRKVDEGLMNAHLRERDLTASTDEHQEIIEKEPNTEENTSQKSRPQKKVKFEDIEDIKNKEESFNKMLNLLMKFKDSVGDDEGEEAEIPETQKTQLKPIPSNVTKRSKLKKSNKKISQRTKERITPKSSQLSPRNIISMKMFNKSDNDQEENLTEEEQSHRDNIDRQKMFMFYMNKLAEQGIKEIDVFSYTIFYPSDAKPSTPCCIIHERGKKLLHVINKKATNHDVKTTKLMYKKNRKKFSKNYLGILDKMPEKDGDLFDLLGMFKANEKAPSKVKICEGNKEKI